MSCTAAAAEAAPVVYRYSLAGEPARKANNLEWALGRKLTTTWLMVNSATGESQSIPPTQLALRHPSKAER